MVARSILLVSIITPLVRCAMVLDPSKRSEPIPIPRRTPTAVREAEEAHPSDKSSPDASSVPSSKSFVRYFPALDQDGIPVVHPEQLVFIRARKPSKQAPAAVAPAAEQVAEKPAVLVHAAKAPHRIAVPPSAAEVQPYAKASAKHGPAAKRPPQDLHTPLSMAAFDLEDELLNYYDVANPEIAEMEDDPRTPETRKHYDELDRRNMSSVINEYEKRRIQLNALIKENKSKPPKRPAVHSNLSQALASMRQFYASHRYYLKKYVRKHHPNDLCRMGLV